MAATGGFPIPARVLRVEETIRRSRFITTLAHAPDAAAARAFVDRIRDEYPDATHHCWAFVAGPPGSTTHVGMSDDGEPRGTAGRPMLTALLHSGVGEVVAVCARYYGGVKLGTGSLGRAYSGGVKLALESLPVEDKVTRIAVEVRIGYEHVDGLRRLLDGMDVVVVDERYGVDVVSHVLVPESDVDRLERGVAGLTRGAGSVTPDAHLG
jgi:uncharacterized YigZ family protein